MLRTSKLLPILLVLLILYTSSIQADDWAFEPEFREYSFGDVLLRISSDTSESQGWPLFQLSIYQGSDIQAIYRNISFQHIFASEDHQYFVGLSNHGVPGTAYVVFDANGRLLREVKHRFSDLDYISKTATIGRYWYDPNETTVDFTFRDGALSAIIVKREGLPDISLL